MVTWGANTTHTIGGSAPATGAAAPATPGSVFGSPSPAPTGSLFGNTTTASSSGTSLFGTPAAAPSGSLFGAAPSSGSTLFGTSSSSSLFNTAAPAPSAFGGTSSLFGTPTSGSTQQIQQPQIPAQAALQAHMDASARQEAERVRAALQRLHAAYSGTSSSSPVDEPKFITIVYDPLTPEQRQLQWLHGMGNGGTILAPNRPPQVSDKQWQKAVVENPDPQNYMPQALIGATALQRRITWQQDRAKDLASHAITMQKSQATIKERASQAQQHVEDKARRHVALRKRLLDVMRRVELARCMNQPVQPDELKASQRLSALQNDVEKARGTLISLQDSVRTQSATSSKTTATLGIPESKKLLPVLKEQREKLEKLTVTAKRDLRDVALVAGRTSSIRRI